MVSILQLPVPKGLYEIVLFQAFSDLYAGENKDQVLEKKGFSPKWRKWMNGCLSSVSYAVLVNGSAKGWVKASRGLRQGDPLSPFLFTLVADVLSRMLLRAEERNMLEGFRVGRNRTRVSHLQFADDTIFFSNTKEEDLQTLKSLLLAFGHISGLKVNLDKSNIYGINLDQAHISRLAETLECKASSWPILYLGLPLGGNPRAGGFWDPVIERISRRLDGWLKAYLSFGGRITLIQSCLTHMPCYYLSLFKLPASVAAKIERLQRDFLWSGIGEGKKDHLVRWDVVCKPKEIGGLGFGNISLRNLALLGKWLWRYPREGSALWHQVILSIYGSHSNGWDANTIVTWSHRCPWKAISQVFQEFSSFTRFVVFPSKFVWNSQIPFKVQSFIWLFQLAKMDWVPPRSILDMMYIKFNGFGSSKRGIALWQAANIALIRIVWRERNARIFEDKTRNLESLWDSIVFLASLWAYCSKVFKGTPLNAIHLDWIAVCTP
ncbi:putative ribonuclease H protein [Vitis vinifera]|uniref:Putative ribonuclease H protein n=1 Tax=Vitis vinifera TaxID=29760 RepID=A0A438JZ62_VITVI|nr:putative ribonuclease H protein [Vitis vinifera]